MSRSSGAHSSLIPNQKTLRQRVLWTFGSTRNRGQACQQFLSPFVTGPFSGAALWLDPTPDSTLAPHGCTCAQMEALDGTVAETVSADRPAVKRLGEHPFAIVEAEPDPFEQGPETLPEGHTILYAVGTLGLFGVRWTARGPLDDHAQSYLTSISPLTARFANVLQGCRPEPKSCEEASSALTETASASRPAQRADDAAARAGKDDAAHVNGDASDGGQRQPNHAAQFEHFLVYFHSHDIPVLLIDPDSGHIRRANGAAEAFYGYDGTTLTQMRIQEINQLSNEEVQKRRAAAEAKEQNRFVFPHRLANGEIRMVRVHSSPVEIPGEGQFLLSIVNDASQEFEARTALKQSRLKYRRLFEQTQDAIVLHGPDNIIREINPRVTDLFGYTEDALVGQPLEVLYAPSARNTVESAKDHMRRAGSTQFELECCREDGTPFWANVTATEVWIGGEPAVQCVVRDVTDRRQAQNKVRDLKDHYEQVLEAMPIQLAIFDPEGHYQYVNPSSISDPDLRGQITGMTDIEYARMRGHDLDRARRRLEAIRRVARTQETDSLEETIPAGDGETEHHRRFLSPVVVDGETDAVAGFGVEITAQKRTEEKLRTARDRAEEALSTRERLMDGLSHDIRTPLNAILGRIETTLRRDLAPDVQTNLRSMRHSSEMLLALIEDLLTLSEIETESFRLNTAPFDPRAVVDEVVDMLRPQAKREGLALHTWTDPTVPPAVAGDALRVRQIVTNLAQNAVKYTEDGAVSITLRSEGDDDSTTDRLVLEIADTGPGLSEEAQDRIFEPYQRAGNEDDVDGKGLGLGVVQEIVDRMEGTIGVESTPGHGALFRVALPLPVADDPSAVLRSKEAQIPDDARLLIVDDTALNREITADLLSEWPVAADMVGDGGEALRRVKDEAYDLVLIDLQMPGMDGYETARRIRDRCPNAGPALVAYTASCTASRWDEMRRAGFDDWIQKPQRAGALRQIIASHVGRAPQRGKDSPIGSPTEPGEDHDTPIMEEADTLPLYDLSFLEENVGTKVGEYVSLFLDQSRRLEEQVDTATGTEDWEAVNMTVHQMKSSARTVGADALLRALRRVEAQRPSPSDDAVQALLERNRDVRQALSSYES